MALQDYYARMAGTPASFGANPLQAMAIEDAMGATPVAPVQAQSTLAPNPDTVPQIPERNEAPSKMNDDFVAMVQDEFQKGNIDPNTGMHTEGVIRGPKSMLWLSDNGYTDETIRDKKNIAKKAEWDAVGRAEVLEALMPLGVVPPKPLEEEQPKEQEKTSFEKFIGRAPTTESDRSFDNLINASMDKNGKLTEGMLQQILFLRDRDNSKLGASLDARAAKAKADESKAQVNQQKVETVERNQAMANKKTLDNLDAYIKDLEFVESALNDGVKGFSYALGSMWPDSKAANMEGKIESLKSALTLDTLLALKKASPNGASGLGSTSDLEMKKLETSIGNINPFKTPSATLTTISRLLKTLKDTRDSILAASGNPQNSQNPGDKDNAVKGNRPLSEMSDEELLKMAQEQGLTQ